MKQRSAAILLMVLFLCCSGCVAGKSKYSVAAGGIISMPQARSSLISYHESGQYFKDVEIKAASVAEALEKALAARVKYPAVIMSVEDVLLSTYPARKEQGFSVNKEARKALESHIILSVLPPVRASLPLFSYLAAKNIPVFLVSNRAEDMRISVMENLSKVGFSGWRGLYMLPARYPENKNFSEEVRKGLVKSGFNIVATVGAVEEDVEGEAAGKAVLYPNYMYEKR
ncbi:HAD family acid phosphatase [Maridesulfovibrio sp.]|uniref:HAD family acid phosphatase n=1 Tax=Maridesulfovibrio sp. TaxID=2795000 RepID=UPI002A18BFDD|nr:HAD family acid phosphatase [Maridesulfovibrio sp.]